jgi:hypothetical protein
MKFINLTPHQVVIHKVSGQVVTTCTVEPSYKHQARCADPIIHRWDSTEIDGIPVQCQRQPGPVSGLPAPEVGVAYLVSRMVLDHPSVSGRRDIFTPDTDSQREVGGVVGVTQLIGRAD